MLETAHPAAAVNKSEERTKTEPSALKLLAVRATTVETSSASLSHQALMSVTFSWTLVHLAHLSSLTTSSPSSFSPPLLTENHTVAPRGHFPFRWLCTAMEKLFDVCVRHAARSLISCPALGEDTVWLYCPATAAHSHSPSKKRGGKIKFHPLFHASQSLLTARVVPNEDPEMQ